MLDLFIVLILCTLAQPSLADTQGKLQISNDSLLSSASHVGSQNQSLLKMDFTHETVLNDGDRFQLRTHAYLKNSRDTREQAGLLFQDLYYEFQNDSNLVKLGVLTPTWEGTDGINPMDLFTAKDYRDLLNIQSFGSFALSWLRVSETGSFELIYIPYQPHGIIPGKDNPWWPREFRLPLNNHKIELRLPATTEYLIHPSESSNNANLHNLATRLQLRSEWGDLSLAAYEGLNPIPYIKPSTLNVIPIQLSPTEIYELITPVEIKPYFYRVRSAAFAYVKVFDPWIFRLSGQNVQATEKQSDQVDWSQQYVLAFERSLYWQDETIVVLLQYAHGIRSESSSLMTVGNLFSKSYILGARIPYKDSHLFQLSSIYQDEDRSSYFNFSWDYRLSEGWGLVNRLDLLSGSENSLLGLLKDRSRYSLSVVKAF